MKNRESVDMQRFRGKYIATHKMVQGLTATELAMSTFQERERIASALAGFLAAPPDGTPSEVIEALGGTVSAPGGVLPPRVFVEAVEQSSVALSITDTNAKILYVNRAFEALTGYSRLEVIGCNQSMLSDKRTPESVYKDLWRTISEGTTWNGTLVNRTKDGPRYLAELTIFPVSLSDESIGYYLGMHRDVTEMHNLERQIQNQKKLTESVIDAAPVAVAVVGTDGRVILDNQAYKVLMADLDGREPSEYILSTVGDLVDGKLRPSRPGETGFRDVEIRFDPSGGRATRWFSCSGTRLMELPVGPDSYFQEGMHEGGLLLVFSEITEQKRQLEVARMAAVQAQLAERQLTQGMRETISGAIFQLDAPLNVLSAAGTMINRQGGSGHGALPALSEVLNGGRQAVDRLRKAMPDCDSGPNGLVDLNQIVREVVDISSSRLLRENIMLKLHSETDLPWLRTCAVNVRSLVKHLIDNAITAVNEPGATAREIMVALKKTGEGYVQLEVSDSGPGIDSDAKLRVFEPFYSAWKSSPGHVGVGLAVAQQIITDSGGSMDVADGPGGHITVLFNPEPANS